MVKITLAAILAAVASVALVGAAPLDTSPDALAARDARLVKVRALRDAVDVAALAKRQGNSAYGHAQGKDHRKENDNEDGHNNDHGKGNNGNGNDNNDGHDHGHGHDNGHGHGQGNDGGNDGVDTDTDPNNCGRRWFVCPQSYNGVGEPICDYGNCRLRCPPGWVNYLSHHPELPNFCAQQS